MYFSQFVIFSSLNLASTGLITVEDQDRVSAEICTSGEQLMYIQLSLEQNKKKTGLHHCNYNTFQSNSCTIIRNKTVDLKKIFYILSNLRQAL